MLGHVVNEIAASDFLYQMNRQNRRFILFSCVSIRIIDIMRIDIGGQIALSLAVCGYNSSFWTTWIICFECLIRLNWNEFETKEVKMKLNGKRSRIGNESMRMMNWPGVCWSNENRANKFQQKQCLLRPLQRQNHPTHSRLHRRLHSSPQTSGSGTYGERVLCFDSRYWSSRTKKR